MRKKILVTGGAGYIGSHTAVELLSEDYDVYVADNLCNSSLESLCRVEEISGKKVHFFHVDMLHIEELEAVFEENNFFAVIHFAGLKAVGESNEIPLDYYTNNISGTLNLCMVMMKHGVKNFVFSSSATVYGDPHKLPIKENFPVSTTNPYGSTKLFAEQILKDIYASDDSWNICLLRYFNPVGAHKSGMIGEDPSGIPNNLMPYISQVAIGRLEELSVYGDDYPTPDGTGIRDYIHVVDLARGHISALKKLEENPGLKIYNLGTGQGYSVLELVSTFENVTGKSVPYRITHRRPGDIAACYANSDLAEKEMGWKAVLGIEDMVRDTWKWQVENPNGYKGFPD